MFMIKTIIVRTRFLALRVSNVLLISSLYWLFIYVVIHHSESGKSSNDALKFCTDIKIV